MIGLGGTIMHFKGARALLSGGLFFACAASAIAQQAATPPPAIFRFPLGVQFELPPGWSWGQPEANSTTNWVLVSYAATRPADASKRNPNSIQVVFNPKASATETPASCRGLDAC